MFSYAIKMRNVNFLKNVIHKVTIILQFLSAKKPKYTREILWQMHIVNINAASPVLQNTYIVNVLVNF